MGLDRHKPESLRQTSANLEGRSQKTGYASLGRSRHRRHRHRHIRGLGWDWRNRVFEDLHNILLLVLSLGPCRQGLFHHHVA